MPCGLPCYQGGRACVLLPNEQAVPPCVPACAEHVHWAAQQFKGSFGEVSQRMPVSDNTGRCCLQMRKRCSCVKALMSTGPMMPSYAVHHCDPTPLAQTPRTSALP